MKNYPIYFQERGGGGRGAPKHRGTYVLLIVNLGLDLRGGKKKKGMKTV